MVIFFITKCIAFHYSLSRAKTESESPGNIVISQSDLYIVIKTYSFQRPLSAEVNAIPPLKIMFMAFFVW